MSGIAGIIRFDGAPVETQHISDMTAAMAYRGPDGINHWVRGSVALGQCMLRTTPESLEETQPLANEDESLVLTMDGRLDNWEELRRDLISRGAKLRTRSDAELVLRAYEVWGRDCVQHIDGDFALVIWDGQKGEAFCARDRMGIKPFHYHWDGKAFVFASDVHSIFALPSVPQLPNEGMIAEFISDEWLSRDETLWIGVMRLVAAHSARVGIRGVAVEQYWAPDLWATLQLRTDEDYFQHYRELLSDVVRRRSRSQKPVVYEVSGGLDSSALFCLAEHLRKSCTLPAPGIRGFTLDFSNDPKANEIDYARAVAKHLGIRIQEIAPTIKDRSWFEEQARSSRDFPGYPNGAMHLGLYEEIAAEGARVSVTGLGGDHFLSGSRAYYAEELSQGHWRSLYDCFKADAKAFGDVQAAKWLVRQGVLPLFPATVKDVFRPVVQYFRGEKLRGHYWLSPQMQGKLNERRAKFGVKPVPRVRCRGQLYLLQAMYYPFDDVGRELCERFGARSGIEIRHPYLASEFIQFAFSTPERLRLRGRQDKYIHKQSLDAILPQRVRERATKAEFSYLIAGHLRFMRETFVDDLPRDYPQWLERDGICRLFSSWVDRPGEGWQSWALWGVYGCNLVAATSNAARTL